MSFNGSGTFVINSSGQPVVAATLITAAAMNALTADLAAGLSACVLKDGTQTITQNLPFNDKKITGLGAGTALTDAASLITIQNGVGVYVATVGGTADVITLTSSPAITAYAAGQTFRFIASGANTTNVTVNVSGLGAKAITKNGTVALVAGDIPAASMVTITYDGTRFILATHGRDFATITGVETLTNKTITTPAISSPTLSGTLAGAVTVPDNILLVTGSADTTKKLAFEVDGLTTATTRTVTIPDRNLTIGPTLAAEQATTSGSAITFSSIPSGTKRITVMLVGVSLQGASSLVLKLGDSGGIESTGYVSTLAALNNGASPSVSNSTTSFFILSGAAGSEVYDGNITLTLENAANNTWSCSSSIIRSTTSLDVQAGTKATSAELTQLEISTAGIFDAGAINISYE